jgi:thiol:disulfide interchange protein
LTVGMGAFGLALALPYALFAIFPQAMKSLPKSGSWLNIVKKSLAFIELAFAIKFLSNADLVELWGILKREVFIGIWLLIALAFAAYLWGMFDKKDAAFMRIVKPERIHRFFTPRRLLSVFLIAFAFYLAPGLTPSKSANLKLLSGFAPPLSYSVYGNKNVKGKGVEPDVINDYDLALELSKKTGKPLLIDFTGWACVNCRKMEEQVWTKKDIEQIIKEQYILVSLYVDDRQKLPVDKQFTFHNKEIRTIGDKWATFQEVNFKGVSQPMYVLLSPDEKLLNLPVGYKSASEYKEWLECGINANQSAMSTAINK